MRGPANTPTLPGRPELPTRGERFDELVLDTVRDIDTRWQDRLGLVEYAVEDTPQLPDDWALDTVPLASLVRGRTGEPSAYSSRSPRVSGGSSSMCACSSGSSR